MRVRSTILDPEQLIARGHFIGKTGRHINGRFQKDRLFSDPELLQAYIRPLAEIVLAHNPTVLVGQYQAAAKLARLVAKEINVPAVGMHKNGLADNSWSKVNTERLVIIEDNVVTGHNVNLLKGHLQAAGQVACGLATLFRSDREYSPVDSLPFSLVHDLDITSWAPNACPGPAEAVA